MSSCSERRSATRVPLDAPCFIHLHILGGGTYPSIIVNISQSGVQLAIPPGCNSNNIPGDSVVLITNTPQHLQQLEGTEAKVAWVGVGHCGLTFAGPVALDTTQLQCL